MVPQELLGGVRKSVEEVSRLKCGWRWPWGGGQGRGQAGTWSLWANSSGLVGKRLASSEKTGLGGERQGWMLKDRSRRNLAQICWDEGQGDDIGLQDAVAFSGEHGWNFYIKGWENGLREGKITILPLSKSLQIWSKLLLGAYARSVAFMRKASPLAWSPICSEAEHPEFTEPHTEWWGLEGTSGDHPVQPPAESGSPTAGCTGPCPGGFRISPEKETPQPLWQQQQSCKAVVGAVLTSHKALPTAKSKSWRSLIKHPQQEIGFSLLSLHLIHQWTRMAAHLQHCYFFMFQQCFR